MSVKGRYSAIPRNVREIMREARQPGGLLAWVKEIFYADHEPETSATRPYLWIHLDDPAMTERWTGARAQKDSIVRVVVEIMLDAQDPQEAYGIPGDDETARLGILTAVEEVGNVIDQQGLGKLPDGREAAINFELAIRGVRKIEGTTWKGEILIEARTRFIAGLR